MEVSWMQRLTTLFADLNSPNSLFALQLRIIKQSSEFFYSSLKKLFSQKIQKITFKSSLRVVSSAKVLIRFFSQKESSLVDV